MDQSAYIKMREVEDDHWWFRARRDILQHVIKKRISTSQPLRILEIGCGTGGNLAMLGRFGSVVGLEMDATAAQKAIARDNAQIVRGQIPDNLPAGQFDLVAMLDVLEHIENEGPALQCIRQNISERGHLLITVPAYKFLWTNHDVVMHHYRRYTMSLLRRRLETNGYTVSYINYFNTILLPLVATTRFLKRALNKTSSDLTIPSPWMNTILYRIFAFEKRLLPACPLPCGVSVIAIATPAKTRR